jgi:hypothetical protein
MLCSGGQLGVGVDKEKEALKRLSTKLGEGKGVYSLSLLVDRISTLRYMQETTTLYIVIYNLNPRGILRRETMRG